MLAYKNENYFKPALFEGYGTVVDWLFQPIDIQESRQSS